MTLLRVETMETLRLTLVCAACVVALACGQPTDGPTQAVCPPPSDALLTYDNFGKAFLKKYCVQCHAATVSGQARNMAPVGTDFDTLEGVKAKIPNIDAWAAAGPAFTNRLMPPKGEYAKPTDEERLKLGEWLACGAR